MKSHASFFLIFVLRIYEMRFSFLNMYNYITWWYFLAYYLFLIFDYSRFGCYVTYYTRTLRTVPHTHTHTHTHVRVQNGSVVTLNWKTLPHTIACTVQRSQKPFTLLPVRPGAKIQDHCSTSWPLETRFLHTFVTPYSLGIELSVWNYFWWTLPKTECGGDGYVVTPHAHAGAWCTILVKPIICWQKWSQFLNCYERFHTYVSTE